MSFCSELSCSHFVPCPVHGVSLLVSKAAATMAAIVKEHQQDEKDGPDLTDVLFDLSGTIGDEADEEEGAVNKEANECLQWLSWMCSSFEDALSELPSRLSSLREEAHTYGSKALSGPLVLQALGSVRELSDHFGLKTLSSRMLFEKEATKKFGETSLGNDFTLKGTTGGMYCPKFLKLVQPLYDMHMGVENMGPLLYSLVRFVKPLHVLEIGAGYTSIFLLQALKDNYEEMKTYHAMQAQGRAHIKGVPWTVADYVSDNCTPGMLHTVDNMAHEHTTAHKVKEIADVLGVSSFLTLHEDDAFTFCSQVLSARPDIMLDLVWIDLGAAHRMRTIMKEYWPRVNPSGGLVCVHSTLTNQLTRAWLEQMRDFSGTKCQTKKQVGVLAPEQKEQEEDRRFYASNGLFETLSFLEPHKCFQNSVSVFQKRGEGYMEPMYTKFP